MKLKKIVFVLVLAFVSIILFNACGDFSLNFPKLKWTYSEAGEDEIDLNFYSLKKDDYKGIYFWDITSVDAENNTFNFSFQYYADKTGDVKKEKYVYDDKTNKFAVLNLTNTSIAKSNETVYYIDEKNKTYSTEIISKYENIINLLFTFGELGIINLKNEDTKIANWEFLKKDNFVDVKTYEGDLETTVQYKYKGATEENKNTTLYINFKKETTPVIARIYYEMENNGKIENTTTIYMPNFKTEITEADFFVPTKARGYTEIFEIKNNV